jgi:hypothetical protein
MPTVLKLKIAVDELDNVLTQFDQIKVYRSTVGINGPYVEATTPATRISLQQGKDRYCFDDLGAEITNYYKTSYYHSGTLLESEASCPRLGAENELCGIMSVEELKQIYLFGLDLTDDAGNPFPDLMFEHGIRWALANVERQLDIRVRPTLFVGERYDYYRDDYINWTFIKLRESPVLSVSRVAVMWPSDTEVIEFPDKWIQLRADVGQVNIVPSSGTLSQVLLTSGGSFLPLLASGIDFVPNGLEVDFVAGFADGQVPMDIRDVIGKYATFPILNTAGDLIAGAGIANKSISIDGLSQTIGTTCLASDSPIGLVGGDQPLIDVVHQIQDGVDLKTWAWDEDKGKLATTQIVGAVESGDQEVYRVSVMGANPVLMTKNHRCLTEHGWLRLKQAVDLTSMRPRVQFQTAQGLCPVNDVSYQGVKPTFDLEVKGPWHSFISNGLVLHNSSATNSGYGARLLQYTKELKEVMPNLRRYYKGIRLTSL